ncbi:MAG: sulfite exporter TauE/SafE family protein [Candidatus Omnitrophica bacterium]|nr:sulfite exporter TauE/SafE family protein [Candidatus Omnitrophota bacterium]
MIITGHLLDYAVVFGAGVLVSLTPCVYPLVPVTMAAIAGANVAGGRWSGFLLSLIYVSGLALVYALLGLIAAMTGNIFGVLQNNPWVLVAVANIFMFFALAFLDVISLPTVRLVTAVRPNDSWSVFMMGAASGFLVGPCTAPALGALLAHIAAKQNILYAVSLLVVFAYGVGASLILAGTLGGVVTGWPKVGAWTLTIKKVSGVILIGFAEYYLLRAGGLF